MEGLNQTGGEQSGKASWSTQSSSYGGSMFARQRRGERAILAEGASHRKTACSGRLQQAVHGGCRCMGQIRLRRRTETTQGHEAFSVSNQRVLTFPKGTDGH